MTRRFRENETGINRSVRILATVGFAVLAGAEFVACASISETLPDRSSGFRPFGPEADCDLRVLSRRDLASLSDGAVRFVPEAAADGWTVYSVSAVE